MRYNTSCRIQCTAKRKNTTVLTAERRRAALALIELKNLGKTFRGKTQTVEALRNINLEINKGDIYGIIGMSGAGKSTLVRCINFLEKPTSGSVVIDGQDLATLTPKQLRHVRQEVSMIFQHFNLLQQRDVRGNIAFAMEIAGMKKADIDKRVDEMLEIVGLTDRQHNYPSQLSGGQQQRVAIARALSTNPKIILCDEATSALDPQTTTSILNLLREINKKMGITIVIITHEMSVVESVCTHVAIIDNGDLVENGTVEDVFSQPKSSAAKKLIFRKAGADMGSMGDRMIRIVFEGNASSDPVIASLVMECHIAVNIMYADTRDVNGKAFGQMILQLPEDKLQQEKAIYYLQSKGLHVEEVSGHGA
ncbi:MAG: ATP-binding cassette domain-containing protein [Clostridia bacterium]|nr:ATP-binding cassette domain-containing protein [Clostridia bacterium]